MEYYTFLEQCNSIEGSIIDASFPGFNNAAQYIDLVNSSKAIAREYLIIDSFPTTPWQPAYDFSNEIQNRIKSKSKLIKQNLSEEHLKKVDKIAFAIIDYDKISVDMIKVLYSYMNTGGIIIIKSTNNLDDIYASLINLLKVKKIVLHKKVISIIKTKDSKLNKIKRSSSQLT